MHNAGYPIHLCRPVSVRWRHPRRRSMRRLQVQAKRTRYGLDVFGGHRYYVGWKRREILEIAVKTGGVD